MRLPVDQRHADVDDLVPVVAQPTLQLRPHTLLDARDELVRHRATDHFVHELEPAPARQWLDFDVAHGVLPVSAGLLHVPPVSLGGLGERRPEADLNRFGVDVGAARAQSREDDVGVCLAHAPQHQLPGLGVAVEPERGVTRDEPGKVARQGVLVAAGLRDDGDRQQRLRHRPGFHQQRFVR